MKYTEQYITRKSRLSAGKFGSGEPSTYTIHSTGNARSTAQNERDNLENNAGSTSFHSVVDEIQCVRCIPFTHRAWHAGDSTKPTGGNMTSISLEICESGDREKTLANAIEVVAHDLSSLGWGVDRLRQHHDWTGKNCPAILRNNNLWEWFVSEVKKKMESTHVYNTLDAVPDWAYPAVSWAINNGILYGTPSGLSLTDESIKTVTMLYRYHEGVKK